MNGLGINGGDIITADDLADGIMVVNRTVEIGTETTTRGQGDRVFED